MLRKLTVILAFVPILLWGQSKVVTGTVTGSGDGMPLPGVDVIVKGTSQGTSTDFDGNYTIKVREGAVLRFSYVGFTTKEIKIIGKSKLNVVLQESAEALGEVVVTALGISREKKALGYSVSELKSDEVAAVKSNDIANSLSGKVAGVVINQPGAGVGSGSRITIRGNNSISGDNQPLIVVDGIPIDNGGANSGGNVYQSTISSGALSDINQDDIESVSVLKGPNAAALYGSRASNGVVLITTKKGEVGKGLGITLNSNTYFDSPMILPDYQNEYGQGSNGNVPSKVDDLKGASGSWGPKFDGSDRLYYTGENRPYVAQKNNVRDFFRTGYKFVNTLSLEGGNERSSLRFSYTNNKTESIIPNSDLSSDNFSLRGFSNVNDKFSVDAKVSYLTRKINNQPSVGSQGIMSFLLSMPRNVAISDLKKYQNLEESYNTISYSSLGANPYWILYNDRAESKKQRMIGFAKATYNFTDWLSAFVRVGTDVSTNYSEWVNQYGHHYKHKGAMGVSNSKVAETNMDFLVMFDKNLTEDINLTANVGGNLSYRTYRGSGISGEEFRIPSRATIANLKKVNPPSYTPLKEKKVNSLYGSASLSFRKFLFLDVTGRNDWSSTLPSHNRSYFYPSVSSSVILSQALDMPEWVNLLKVRGSWAQVGSDTEPYQIYQYYNVSGNGYLDATQVSKGGGGVKFKSDLKPEKTNSLETGVEFRLFGNRLFADFSYYNIKINNLIFDVDVPQSTGYNKFRENVGEMQNKGFEFLLGGVPVKTDDFEWEIIANFSKNKNTLNELTEDLDSHPMNEINSGNVFIKATVGGGYGDIYGTTWKKNEEGQIVVNDKGYPMASSEKKLLGNAQPDWVGGLTNTFRYKGFSARFLIDARIGGEVYGATIAGLDGSGVSKESLKYRDGGILVDAVVEQKDADGNITYIPNDKTIPAEKYWSNVSGIASEYVFDQTNVRLRELAISYTLPKSIFKNNFVKGASIGVVGRNLFFLYKKMKHFDPEGSLGTNNKSQGIMINSLPTSRSIGFSFNVQF